jgi:hypothetical protein
MSAITILALLLGWAGLRLIDAGAELDDARSQQAALERDLRLLSQLAVELHAGADRVKTVQALHVRHAGHVKDKDAQRVSVDGIVFVFNADRLAAVQPMSLPIEPPPPAPR